MIYFDVILFIICFISLRFNKEKSDDKWLTATQTTTIKGIFIIIVFLSHIRGYITSVNVVDTIHNELYSLIGQRMVVYFLLCSGYGVMENIKRKDKLYINTIPRRRVLNVLVKFDIVVVIYILLDIFINQGVCSYSVVNILLSFIGWESVGNSNWYVFAIIFAYISTWIAFSVTKKHSKGIVITFLLSIIYVIILHLANKGTWWYDTIMCYPFGMFISLYKEKVASIFSKKVFFFSGLIITIVGTFMPSSNIIVQMFQMLLFGMAMILLTMQISFDNIFLNWCGKNLFGIYILQRIPMIVLKAYRLTDEIHIYTIACFVICCLLAYLFELLTKKLDRIICTDLSNNTGS